MVRYETYTYDRVVVARHLVSGEIDTWKCIDANMAQQIAAVMTQDEERAS